MPTGKLFWSILGCIFLLASPCRADFVQARLDNVTSASTVMINLGDGSPANISYAYAGYVNWSQQGSPKNPALGSTFSTFCIELTQDVYFGSTYNFTVKALEDAPNPGSAGSGGSGGMGVAKADALRELWAGFYNSIGTNSKNAAAFQLAIWKIEYDWGSANFDNFASGNFRAADASGYPGVTALAKTLVDRVGHEYQTKVTNLVALSGDTFQDQITQTAVPAPPAWCLALCGGVVLLAAHRFRITGSTQRLRLA
jgi:hypothetical protein